MLLVVIKCEVCKGFRCVWQKVKCQRNDSYDFVIKIEKFLDLIIWTQWVIFQDQIYSNIIVNIYINTIVNIYIYYVGGEWGRLCKESLQGNKMNGPLARADIPLLLFLFPFETKKQGLNSSTLVICIYQFCTNRSAFPFQVIKSLIWLYWKFFFLLKSLPLGKCP